jgi:hypothetical protein
MNTSESITTCLSAPVALHWTIERDERVLVAQLKAELALEREKTSILTTELIQAQQRSQHLQCYLNMLNTSDKPSIPRVESWSSFSTAPDYKIDDLEEPPKVGIYSPQVRLQKIQRYKEKLRKYKAKVHVSRKFKGRSFVAKLKPRVKGKFVKSAESS